MCTLTLSATASVAMHTPHAFTHASCRPDSDAVQHPVWWRCRRSFHVSRPAALGSDGYRVHRRCRVNRWSPISQGSQSAAVQTQPQTHSRTLVRGATANNVCHVSLLTFDLSSSPNQCIMSGCLVSSPHKNIYT